MSAIIYQFRMDQLPPDFGKRLGRIDDLPEELRRNLQLTDMSELDKLIVSILTQELQGAGTLNEILVWLYRRQAKVYDRAFVSNKLYRMDKAGYIERIKGKKGAYKLPTLA